MTRILISATALLCAGPAFAHHGGIAHDGSVLPVIAGLVVIALATVTLVRAQ